MTTQKTLEEDLEKEFGEPVNERRDDECLLKIIKSGKWYVATLKDVRKINQTKYANYPQFVLDFEIDVGGKSEIFPLWSKTLVNDRSRVIDFLESVLGDPRKLSEEVKLKDFLGLKTLVFIGKHQHSGNLIIVKFRSFKE